MVLVQTHCWTWVSPAGCTFSRVLVCFGLRVPTKNGSKIGPKSVEFFFFKSDPGPRGACRCVFSPFWRPLWAVLTACISQKSLEVSHFKRVENGPTIFFFDCTLRPSGRLYFLAHIASILGYERNIAQQPPFSWLLHVLH